MVFLGNQNLAVTRRKKKKEKISQQLLTMGCD
jgi:hypothetical protein